MARVRYVILIFNNNCQKPFFNFLVYTEYVSE